MNEPQNDQKVVTRFAPSPTGIFHVGSVRTALFSYLYAKKNAGKFILRIEDTDKARSLKEHEDMILDSMKWLGLSYDEFYRQSERTAIYKEQLEKLLKEDKIYISQEKVEKEGDRAEVIRFRNPNKKVVFEDIVRGQIEFDTTELGDFVIAKSLEEPVFHFVVVVDDFLMGVTHVIRGEDHISNTPRHILIQEALGAPRPQYAHLPLILGADRSKLSKRKHGESVSLKNYIDQGYIKEAIINYMALLGWNPGTEQELFSIEELIQLFDLAKVQKGGAIFNDEKLKWFNKEYLKKIPESELESIIKPILAEKYSVSDEMLKNVTPIIFERISTIGEIKTMIERGELDYFFNQPQFDVSGLLWKGKGELSQTAEHLKKVSELLEKVPEAAFNAGSVKEAIWPYAEEVGRGDVLWPTRFALSGRDKSPDPFILAGILGKPETLNRLNTAVQNIQK